MFSVPSSLLDATDSEIWCSQPGARDKKRSVNIKLFTGNILEVYRKNSRDPQEATETLLIEEWVYVVLMGKQESGKQRIKLCKVLGDTKVSKISSLCSEFSILEKDEYIFTKKYCACYIVGTQLIFWMWKCDVINTTMEGSTRTATMSAWN